MSATFTALMCFKNKHYLNKEVLPPPCPPCILDMYILVSNKPMPSIALKLSSSPKIVTTGIGVGVGVGVGVSKVSLVVKDSNMVTPRCS